MAGVQLEHVVREYTMGRTTIRAVDDISFTIPEGKYTIILGASGAGKSTVLNILGGMDSPTSGPGDGQRQGDLGLQQASAYGVPPGEHRLCLSVLQPDAQSDGAGERGAGQPDL